MANREETVFIFGAGATRGGFESGKNRPHPPLDLDFFDIVGLLSEPGTYKLARTVLQDVWDLYGITSGISLERYYRDIETREIIGRFAKSANKQKDWQRRKKNLEELIRRAIVHTTCDMNNSPLKAKISEVHKQLFDLLRSGDTIITFNYDMVIEESIDKTKLWSPVDGYGAKVHNTTNSWCKHWLKSHGGPKKRSKVLLLKLHGSINWSLYKNREIRIQPRPYVLRIIHSKPVAEKMSILPPGQDKPIHKNPFKQLWRTARLKLEACKNIVIIGYSLPEADLLARALFSEVCRLREVRGKYFVQFHVIDPSKATQDKMIDMFSQALGPDSHVFRHNSISGFIAHYG